MGYGKKRHAPTMSKEDSKKGEKFLMRQQKKLDPSDWHDCDRNRKNLKKLHLQRNEGEALVSTLEG